MSKPDLRKDIVETFKPLYETGLCDYFEFMRIGEKGPEIVISHLATKGWKAIPLVEIIKNQFDQIKEMKEIEADVAGAKVFATLIPEFASDRLVSCVMLQGGKALNEQQKRIAASLSAAMKVPLPSEKNSGDNDRYREELVRMRSMQAKLFPRFEGLVGLDISSVFLPAALMSGSFIDAKSLDGKIYQIVACDVLGFDASSNFTSAAIRTLVLSFSSAKTMPSALVELVVERLRKMPSIITSIIYLTVYQINTETGQTRISSYGDVSTIYYNATKKGYANLGETSIGQDLSKRSIAKDISLTLTPGDMLLFYSQGAINAKSENGQGKYGGSNLVSVLRDNSGKSATDIAHALTDSIYTFTNYAPTEEDILLLCIKKQ